MPPTLPDRDRSRAVLIGTSRYEHLPQLPAVHGNLHALRSALTDERTGGFAPEHCVVVENPKGVATTYDVLRSAAFEATDTLLVYYAGHGLVGTKATELYPGLPDSTADDADRLWIEALDFERVRGVMRWKTAKNRILVLDCCFSGRSVGDFMSPVGQAVAEATAVSGTVTLASSAGNEVSLAPDGAEFTAFSGELVKLLRNGIPGEPELLSLDAIFALLEREMRVQGNPVPTMRTTDGGGSLALVRNRAAMPNAPQWPDNPPRRSRRGVLKAALGAGVLGAGGWGVFTLVRPSATPQAPADAGPQPPAVVPTAPDRPEAVVFSPAGDLLVAGSYRTLRMWDTRSRQELPALDAGAMTRSLAFSPDGAVLAVGSVERAESGSKVLLWDVRTRRLIGELPAEHGNWVDGVAFDRTGAMLATCGHDEEVRLWDAERRTARGTLTGHGGTGVHSVAFHPEEDFLASAGNDKTVRIWNLKTQQQWGDALVHPETVRAVAYSPVDGAMIATACWNKEVWLWDAGTRKVIDRFPATSINTCCLAFRPDGLLAAAGYAPEG
ncbi:WD domain-containing protein, G-beta repeat-containing protein [Saccharopolyspora kobensis]|uniref:WD domain-containing protein, G-beta repeat-containing protein n=1 Tax=Saccharopolyspora kobensis TaxID=146035 RepID=A0A1H6CCE0_9PSEU|nr:caspase family protein [Saccharopolyspora kobensis]SEG70437.1 WD domain-containing protein, G-beta repeat-containing protein [Saccharopolyspora kobensis]SFC35008.1 WD domain-containing protein, G-beta repeat-containing protein [Saccharopolyspora kobensis]